MICVILMVLLAFQPRGAAAGSCKDWYGYNRALASCGAAATASGSSNPNTPAQANDGVNSSYWQSSSTTGWLAIGFNQRYSINQVHIHFLAGSTIYPKLSLYADTSANGKYESSEKVKSLTSNSVRDVIIDFTTAFTLGINVTIDAKVGSNNPKIAALEAYLLNDSDGDGLTNDQETATVYYQDMAAGGMPSAIPDAGTGVLSSASSLTPFNGIPQRALANFTVDHPSKSDLSATVGYWNGTDWTDSLVWDPGVEVRGIRINKPDMFGYYTGVVSVSALVKDPDTALKVEYRVNGTLKKTVYPNDGYVPSWSWDTTSLGDSLPTLNATRYDRNGSKAWDQLVVKVNNIPPTAAWLAPGNATRAQGNVTLIARATDFHGIDRVEFYVDGALKSTISASNAGPNNYSWVWNSLPFSSGWHTVKLIAWDIGGLKSAGVSRSLYVDNVLGVAILRPTATGYYTGTVGVVASVEDTSVTTKVEFRVDGVLKATVTSPTGGNFTWNWTTANEDALRVVNVTQYDAVGPGAWYQVTVKVDNLPPTNVWMSPLNGNTVHDSVTLKVSAADFYGIQKVRFFADGSLVGEDTTPDPGTNYFTALWDTAQYCHNDQHTLSATAIENTALAKSATPYISVFTNTDPLVCITGPANNAIIRGTTYVNASTVSVVGISRVEFYVDIACPPSPTLPARFTDYAAPYQWSWDTTRDADGAKCVMVKAYNNQGKSDVHMIVVQVNNACGPPYCGAPTQGPDAGTQASATMGILAKEWTPGETDAGTKATLVVDLTGPPGNITAAERAAGLVRPSLPAALFESNLQWRLVVRDWVPGIAGNVTVFILRFEAKSDPQNPDTDGDGIPDGTEVNLWHTLPVARDSDVDGLTDDYEIAQHSETVTANGVTTILAPYTTDPAKWDSDGDGLGDGQERGFISFGMTKTIGEVGTISGITQSPSWTTVYLHNHYTAAVVFAEPASLHYTPFSHVRIQAVTDHTFQLRMEGWPSGDYGPGESVAYLVLESGDYFLPDGSTVEVGTTSVGTAPVTVAFRESFGSTLPYVLVQTQTTKDSNPVIANRTGVLWPGGFGVRLNANASSYHLNENVSYVAISPQSNPGSLATWTRAEVYFLANQTQGRWRYPTSFAQPQAPLILAWMGAEAPSTNTQNLGLRLVSSSNASATVYREQSGPATADKVDFFAFPGPMNLTARMTTKANGTGSADSDGDGVTDGDEVNTYGSNPTLKDTDADGIPDNVEVTSRTMSIPINGTLKSITFTTSPTSPDTDADGIPDLQEIEGVLDHRILYYDMATLSSGSVIRDLSGAGAEGNLKYVQTSTTGQVGGSILFNGTQGSSANRIQVPSTPWLNLTDGFTIASWVKPTATSQGATIVAKGYGNSASFAVDIAKSGSKYYFRAYLNGVSSQVLSATSITTGTWYFVAAAYDFARGTLSLYVNTANPATISNVPAISTNTHDVTIGSREWSSTSGYNMTFKGYIDEVQVWDRPRSMAELQRYRNLTAGSANLVSWLDMETRTSYGNLFDFSGAGHQGVASGTTVVEGRSGLARRFAGGSAFVDLNPTNGVSYASGVSLSLYVLVDAYPTADAPVVSQYPSFYLNLTSDGRVAWSIPGRASLATPLPIALNRWVRLTATATGSNLVLYLDGATVATSTISITIPQPTNDVILGGCNGAGSCFVGVLDEVLLMNTVPSAWSLADVSVGGVQLNPGAADTDGDGLPDGQEVFTTTVKTPGRYPFPAGGSRQTDALSLNLGAPAWALTQAVAMVGITEPDMGDVRTSLDVYRSGQFVNSLLLKQSGVNAGQTNNFTSYDLFLLGLSRADLVRPGAAFDLLVNDVGTQAGQAEYLQIQVTAHTLPNRADTDKDGLNDSEEATLGRDGYATSPWKTDTDADGILDGLESNGWSWSGTAIVSDPNGFRTDPTRADTDRDGVPDGRDRVPAGDAFIDVVVYSIKPLGTGASDGDSTLHPFASITVGNQTAYTDWTSVASGSTAYILEDFVVNVDDASPTVLIAISAWDYDTRIENGYHDDVHEPLQVSTFMSGGSCYGNTYWAFTYVLGKPDGTYTTNSSSGTCPGATYLRADPIVIHTSTVIAQRALAYLVTPGDYSGVYNLTNSQGTITSRRYVGESQFIGIVLNVTWLDGNGAHHDPYAYLVPRSVFFESLLYKDLSTGNLVDPLGSLSFAANSTSAWRNPDALQEVLTGNVTAAQRDTILALLRENGTGATVHGIVPLTPMFYADALFLYSLPDDAIRLVAYEPSYSYAAATYRFCTTPNCQASTTTLSIWAQIWLGIVNTVTGWIVSALVIAATAFRVMLTIFKQIGAWLWDNVIAPVAAKVKSVVAAAQKALSQLVDFVTLLVRIMVQQSVGPLLFGLSASASETRLSIQSTYPAALSQFSQTGSVDSATLKQLVSSLMGSYVWTLLGLSAAVVAIGIVLYPIAPIGAAIMTVAGAIAGALLFKAIAGYDLAAPAVAMPSALPNPFASSSVFDIAMNYASQVDPNGDASQRKFAAALDSIVFGAFSAFIGLAAVTAVDPSGTALALAGVVLAAVAALLAGAATLPGGSGLALLALGFATAGVASALWGLLAAYVFENSGAIFVGWIALELSLGAVTFAVLSM